MRWTSLHFVTSTGVMSMQLSESQSKCRVPQVRCWNLGDLGTMDRRNVFRLLSDMAGLARVSSKSRGRELSFCPTSRLLGVELRREGQCTVWTISFVSLQ